MWWLGKPLESDHLRLSLSSAALSAHSSKLLHLCAFKPPSEKGRDNLPSITGLGKDWMSYYGLRPKNSARIS